MIFKGTKCYFWVGVERSTLFLVYELENQTFVWFFAFFAILFNPLIPTYLDRELWLVIDGAVGLFMLASIFILKPNEKENEK